MNRTEFTDLNFLNNFNFLHFSIQCDLIIESPYGGRSPKLEALTVSI